MSAKRRATVSAVLIVKDEEAALEESLRSVAWADEVVVYDTGSTDRTVEIAREHATTVVEGYWDDDFGAARSRALAHATSEWALAVDADEVAVVDADRLRRELAQCTADIGNVIVVNVGDRPRLPLEPEGELEVFRFAGSRLLRRATCHWVGALHEQPRLRPEVTGRALTSARVTSLEIRHRGYSVEVVAERGKGERNVALAQRMLDAVGPDTPAWERESRQVHLVRSYVFAGQHAEAVELAEQVRAGGFVVARTAASLARTMYSAALLLGDDALAELWLDVWEEHEDNPAFAIATRARHAANRDDPEATLAALRALPTTTLNALGEEVRRIELVHEEVWALVRVGDRRRALKVAAAAVDAGVAPGAPGALGVLLGHERTVSLVARLDDRLWGDYVTRCVMDATDETRTFLRRMHEARPGDPKVLAAVAVLRPTLSLEEAVEWSVELRRHGAAQQCPLVAFAADARVEPRIRALAGALAWSAYRDERGLAGLEEALALVPAGSEAALLAELDVVAPGLVGAA